MLFQGDDVSVGNQSAVLVTSFQWQDVCVSVCIFVCLGVRVLVHASVCVSVPLCVRPCLCVCDACFTL